MIVPEDEDEDILEEDINPIFKMKPSDFSSDIEYSRAIIREVRRMHSIDDRLENARKESLSKNHLTRNIWPTPLSCPLVRESDRKMHAKYFVKAFVPIYKHTYR